MIKVVVVVQNTHVVDIILIVSQFLRNCKVEPPSGFIDRQVMRITNLVVPLSQLLADRHFTIYIVRVFLVIDIKQCGTYIGVRVCSASQYISIDK